jgi:hypothetical protein
VSAFKLSKQAICSNWTGVVTHYVRSSLTVATNRLPTISGVAKCFQDALQDEYFVGVWKMSYHIASYGSVIELETDKSQAGTLICFCPYSNASKSNNTY